MRAPAGDLCRLSPWAPAARLLAGVEILLNYWLKNGISLEEPFLKTVSRCCIFLLLDLSSVARLSLPPPLP